MVGGTNIGIVVVTMSVLIWRVGVIDGYFVVTIARASREAFGRRASRASRNGCKRVVLNDGVTTRGCLVWCCGSRLRSRIGLANNFVVTGSVRLPGLRGEPNVGFVLVETVVAGLIAHSLGTSSGRSSESTNESPSCSLPPHRRRRGRPGHSANHASRCARPDDTAVSSASGIAVFILFVWFRRVS